MESQKTESELAKFTSREDKELDVATAQKALQQLSNSNLSR